MRSEAELPRPHQVDWASLIVVYWITLISEAARGLVLPSAWPFVKSFGGSKADLGIFVASFSVGRMATTVPLGYLSDTYDMATVLVVASLVQAFGHTLYAFSSSLLMLTISRIFVGLGSATTSVCRAHLTRTVLPEQRTHHFAYLSAIQFIGGGVLPGIGGLLAELPEFRVLGLNINGFTYPAYVLISCNIVSLLLLSHLFTNPPEQANRYLTRDQRQDELVLRTASLTSSASSPPNDLDEEPLSAKEEALLPAGDVLEEHMRTENTWALYVCIVVNFTFRGLMAELETITTPVLMERYHLSYGKSSYCISLIGVVGLGVYLSFKLLSRRFSDRALMLLGLLLVLVGAVPLAYPPVAQSLPLTLHLTLVAVLWSLAYPIGQTSVLSLFSKALGKLPAGSFLGLFSAIGSVARILFALLAGFLFGHLGQEAVFAVIAVCMALSIVLVVANYRRLVSAC